MTPSQPTLNPTAFNFASEVEVPRQSEIILPDSTNQRFKVRDTYTLNGIDFEIRAIRDGHLILYPINARPVVTMVKPPTRQEKRKMRRKGTLY